MYPGTKAAGRCCPLYLIQLIWCLLLLWCCRINRKCRGVTWLHWGNAGERKADVLNVNNPAHFSDPAAIYYRSNIAESIRVSPLSEVVLHWFHAAESSLFLLLLFNFLYYTLLFYACVVLYKTKVISSIQWSVVVVCFTKHIYNFTCFKKLLHKLYLRHKIISNQKY